MKRKTQFHLLLITGLLITTITACKKTNDPSVDSKKPVIVTGSFKDIDGNVYKTVKIGSQEWMAENLKTNRYNDSTLIPNVTNDSLWSNLTTGAYCNYDNLESNVATYGRLYNWYAVNSGKLAPAGWHVPTMLDWNTLEYYLATNGYNYDGTNDGNKFAKSLASTTGWASSDEIGSPGANPEGNNSTGFTALPGGLRGPDGLFRNIGENGWWWTSYYNGSYAGISCYLLNYDYGLGQDRNSSMVCGLSVRLIRD